MDSAHICINLFAKSAKQDVLDAAQPVNLSMEMMILKAIPPLC
jgi:hypothetical protein